VPSGFFSCFIPPCFLLSCSSVGSSMDCCPLEAVCVCPSLSIPYLVPCSHLLAPVLLGHQFAAALLGHLFAVVQLRHFLLCLFLLQQLSCPGVSLLCSGIMSAPARASPLCFCVSLFPGSYCPFLNMLLQRHCEFLWLVRFWHRVGRFDAWWSRPEPAVTVPGKDGPCGSAACFPGLASCAPRLRSLRLVPSEGWQDGPSSVRVGAC